MVNVEVAQYKERKGEVREQLLRGKGAVGGGSLVGAVHTRNTKPRERKIKKPGGGKNIERK